MITLCIVKYFALYILFNLFVLNGTIIKHEIEVERDLFASEVGRLQNGLERLKNTQNHICDEKKELKCLLEKVIELEKANKQLKDFVFVCMHSNSLHCNYQFTSIVKFI
jgi:cell shape-determining protein MreC